MGWILDIYLLENLSIVSILKFFRIGILHSIKERTFGVIFGLHKIDIRLTIGNLKMPKVEGETANA